MGIELSNFLIAGIIYVALMCGLYYLNERGSK